MNAITRSPYRRWDMLNDMDSLWNGFFTPARAENSEQRGWAPAMDIVENENGYVVKTDLPGVKKENLSVNVKDKTLVIEANTESENVEKEGETVVKRERHSGSYRRALKLGNEIDEGAISADYSDGVLTLVLPKALEANSRSIDITVN